MALFANNLLPNYLLHQVFQPSGRGRSVVSSWSLMNFLAGDLRHYVFLRDSGPTTKASPTLYEIHPGRSQKGALTSQHPAMLLQICDILGSTRTMQ